MKQKLLTLMLLVLLPLAASAQVRIGDLYYWTNDENYTAGVTHGTAISYTGDVVIPKTVWWAGKTYNVTSIRDGAFRGSSVTSVTIPNSVTIIGGDAFKECTSLKKVTIPNTVTRIVYNAFEGCSSLKEITIPNSLTYIEGMTFYKCI